MKTSYYSATGSSHKRLNSGCQDSSLISVCPLSGDVVAVVSDGAGSARYGSDGSAMLVRELSAALLQLAGRKAVSLQTFSDCVKATILSIRNNIVLEGAKLQDFHATLICLLRTDANSFLAHIGDGVGILFFLTGGESNKSNVVFSLPENGESSNETFFFTDPSLESVLRIRYIPKRVDAFILSTDGMQDFLFDSKQGLKHKFCNDVLNELILSDAGATKDLARLITGDPRTDQYTNDDKTIAMGISQSLSKMPALDDQFVIDASNAAILWRSGSETSSSVVPLGTKASSDRPGIAESSGTIIKKNSKVSTNPLKPTSKIATNHLRFYQALSLSLFLLLAGAVGYILLSIPPKTPDFPPLPTSVESVDKEASTPSGIDDTNKSNKSSAAGQVSEQQRAGDQEEYGGAGAPRPGDLKPSIGLKQGGVESPTDDISAQSDKAGMGKSADTLEPSKNLPSNNKTKAPADVETAKTPPTPKTSSDKGNSK